MIPKPSKCIGCPLYQYGKYFTPDTVVSDSKVTFIAQNPGPDEEAGHKLIKRHWHGNQYTDEHTQVTPAPLIGATGKLFHDKFLPLTGLLPSEVSLGNAIRCRPGLSLGLQSDGLPPITSKMSLATSKADIVRAMKHCRDAYLVIPPTTKLIVTMGRYAMYSLTGIQHEESEYGHKQGVVESWRGYAVDTELPVGHPFSDSWYIIDTTQYHDLQNDNIKIFFTMHIAALFKGVNKRYYHATLQDFMKIRQLLDGKWPLPLPSWHTTAPSIWPRYAAFDTEYIPGNNQLIRWSLCDTANNLYCVESVDTSDEHVPIVQGSTVLIQNALADISHLAHIIDITHVNIEDMMLADSVLWTGEPHSLNYIASKYGAFNRYKHLSVDSPQLYSALDAYEPMYMWRHHYLPEFKADQQSWNIYKKYRLPLINIIDKAQRAGVAVDTGRLSDVQQILQAKLDILKVQAQTITGDERFTLGGRTAMIKAIYNE